LLIYFQQIESILSIFSFLLQGLLQIKTSIKVEGFGFVLNIFSTPFLVGLKCYCNKTDESITINI